MTHFKIYNVGAFNADLAFRGIPYSEIDRTGHWSVWCIGKTLEAARAVAQHLGFLCIYEMSEKQGTIIFIVKQVIKLSPKLHEATVKTQMEARVSMKFKRIGRTSLVSYGKFENGLTGDVLGEIWLKYVQIDPSTRRPKAFLESMINKFRPFVSNDIPSDIDNTDIPEMPPSAFKCTVITRHSDTDSNNHVNQSVYMQYCMDCATDAVRNGFYRNLSGDICLYPSTEWKMSHVGESLANEFLDVYTWQNEENAKQIFFSILRDKKLIFHAETTFDLKTTISKL